MSINIDLLGLEPEKDSIKIDVAQENKEELQFELVIRSAINGDLMIK